MFKAFLVKYAEIGIKGKNRYLFEDALIRQMEYVLKDVEGTFRVTKEQGRIYVQTEGEFDYDETLEALKRVFGIAYICPVVIREDEGFEKLAADVEFYEWNLTITITDEGEQPDSTYKKLSAQQVEKLLNGGSAVGYVWYNDNAEIEKILFYGKTIIE